MTTHKELTGRLALLAMLALSTACGGPHETLDKIFGGGEGGNGGQSSPPPKVNAPYPQFQLTVDTYADCDALNADMRALVATRREEELRYKAWQEEEMRRWSSSGGSAKASASQVDNSVPESADSDQGSDGGGGGEESFTNTQEKGVDEADVFKVGERHLFAALEGRIEVVARASLARLGTLDTKGLGNVTLYTGKDRLVVVGQRQEQVEGGGADGISVGDDEIEPSRAMRMTASTEVRIYDAAGAALPVLATTKTYPGAAFDSRSVGGHLILVFSDYLWLDDPTLKPYSDGSYFYGNSYGAQTYNPWMYFEGDLDAVVADKPVRLDANGTVGGTPCNAIMKQTVADYDLRLTRVISLDTSAPEAAEKTAAILGGGDQIYMSTGGLYIAKTGVEWFSWAFYGGDSEEYRMPPERLVVTRVLFDQATGAIAPVAAGQIEGRIKDEWSFKEFPEHDVLAVATSTGELWSDGANKAQNHLWMLKANGGTHNLDVVASVRDFGTGEDIRAVRYVGSTAYIVTFKKTDPLFAFDLTDPLAPRLLGELKIPGFSVYMHPVQGDLMVGIGFDAADQGDFAYYQGLQVSLFDIKDPTNLARIDNELIGSRGSYSEVTSDHHAFFYDAETSLMAVPVVELQGGSGQSWDYGSSLKFSGAILYDVGRELTERGRITHADLIPANCRSILAQGRWWQESGMSLDVNRVFKVDGRLLSFSRFGLRAHPLASPATTERTVAFLADETSCY